MPTKHPSARRVRVLIPLDCTFQCDVLHAAVTRWCEGNGKAKTYVAQRMGIGEAHLYRILAGQGFEYRTLLKLCRMVGVPVGRVLTNVRSEFIAGGERFEE